jgi:hypothetical protein
MLRLAQGLRGQSYMLNAHFEGGGLHGLGENFESNNRTIEPALSHFFPP